MVEAQHIPRSITKGSIYTHAQGSKSVETIDKCENRKCKTKCELETNTCHKASQYRQRDKERGKRQEWLWYSKAQHRLKEGGWATGNKPKKTASKWESPTLSSQEASKQANSRAQIKKERNQQERELVSVVRECSWGNNNGTLKWIRATSTGKKPPSTLTTVQV